MKSRRGQDLTTNCHEDFSPAAHFWSKWQSSPWESGDQNPLWHEIGLNNEYAHTGSLWLDLFQNSRNIAFAKIWHFLALVALKDTKKPIKYWKRPTKAVKVILKARESKSGKILILLHLCDHLVSKMKRIQYFDVSRS